MKLLSLILWKPQLFMGCKIFLTYFFNIFFDLIKFNLQLWWWWTLPDVGKISSGTGGANVEVDSDTGIDLIFGKVVESFASSTTSSTTSLSSIVISATSDVSVASGIIGGATGISGAPIVNPIVSNRGVYEIQSFLTISTLNHLKEILLILSDPLSWPVMSGIAVKNDKSFISVRFLAKE